MSEAEGPKLGTARAPRVPVADFAALLPPVPQEPEGSENQDDESSASAPEPEKPLPTVETEPSELKPVPAPKAATRTADKPAKATVRTQPAQQPDSERESTASKGINLSLPASIDERLMKYKGATGLSHPSILFRAVESVHDRLQEIVSATLAEPSSGPTLFSRPPEIVRSHDNEPRVDHILLIKEEHKAILNDLWRAAGAPSRNAMLIAVYDAFLPND